MTDPIANPPATRPVSRPCAQCGKPVVQAFRPFCSARCRDVDLGKWLTEGYVLPGRTPISDNLDEE